MNIREAIGTLIERTDLSQDNAAQVMEEIMTGTATPAQIAAFLTALRMKGETAAEIAGMAQVMQMKSNHVPFDGTAVDTCGTGGDGVNTFNISTTVAFVVAGAGVTVAKHGNRAMSSASGSADVLDALGVNIDLNAEGVLRCLHEANIGFMFAPNFHPSMRYAGPVRREMGIRTIFNILGPLTNPARVRHQIIGVPHETVAHKVAWALGYLGTARSFVVHGHGGMDELSLSGPSSMYEVYAHREPTHMVVEPTNFGIERAPIEALRGGNANENAAITLAILNGTERGPKRDVVVLNAAVALMAGQNLSNLHDALYRAQTSIDEGQAKECLERLKHVSYTLA